MTGERSSYRWGARRARTTTIASVPRAPIAPTPITIKLGTSIILSLPHRGGFSFCMWETVLNGARLQQLSQFRIIIARGVIQDRFR
ncbi:MAG: hypothetical protein PGN16_18360 [Sphingomonas phyllosphaerae]|uniref:hypothetical protein n=1 Tax=Sphingomonas phyllosphaerae TaxID=257003 RepID=UPI002FFB0BCA